MAKSSSKKNKNGEESIDIQVTFNSANEYTLKSRYGKGKFQTETLTNDPVQNIEYDPAMWDAKEVLDCLNSDNEDADVFEGDLPAGYKFDDENDDLYFSSADLLPKDAMQKQFDQIVHEGANFTPKYQKNDTGMTQYPLSSSKVKRSVYLKQLDSQFNTVYTQYTDGKLGAIADTDYDLSDQMVITNTNYIDQNKIQMEEVLKEVRPTSVFDDDNKDLQDALINNLAENYERESEEENENQEDSQSSDEFDQDDKNGAFDAKSVHSQYQHSFFAPKLIDIRREKKSAPKPAPEIKPAEKPKQINIKPIMHKAADSKMSNKERKKILKTLKREKRQAKKSMKISFKANEALQKQNMYSLNQNISSLRF